ncbi:unnamed protein product [Clonostachys byssicola]|uniref:Uncharacterized protein n=1 Tax=Clonostachys byssicola TaxID=160290 RepID=A0A9N9U282_9HYPO|nr:unnamed protein product [Clonostachys byssicola]
MKRGGPVHVEIYHLRFDSLMTLEVVEKLNAEGVPGQELLGLESCKTVRDVIQLIEMSPPKPPTTMLLHTANMPHLLKSGPKTTPPLCLIRNGSGTKSMYARIRQLSRCVYGISARYLGDFRSVPELASAYAGMIDQKQPIILGGT